MHIVENKSLKSYNTFSIDAIANHFVSVNSIQDLKAVLNLEGYPEKLILGGGSNMLLTKDQESLVIHVNIKGISVISEDDRFAIVKANAGENWHEFVLFCLEHNLGGVENLSLIPGNVGTAPIQNIGAYGVELKDSFVSCEAISLETMSIDTFSKNDCKFGYRDSIFKNEGKGKYIVTSVTFKLSKQNHKLHINYGTISNQLGVMHITEPTIQEVSKAVISIRESKLPNPKDIGNSGSFFKNPVVSKAKYESLITNFSDIPSYTISENEIKIPAGWLIEKAGFKGKRFGACGVHKKQALVLVNYGGAKGSEILELSKLIQKTVDIIFGIFIEAEVNIL
ncbi:UDP-N-acetylmuramate dehydrogenase [Changchengzhania lutea]|uniref:UDP-N-acetylmuramate dehydrogenase n=1 Tax=Changchengzhania lutea TaxID=2049305 RepID=UPI00115D265D|nr:UDP-N-acetylmuramate dehydrogenase [Changchengzhania lutea]